MVDEIYWELIHKEIDGVITPEEQTRLRAYLRTHPEAQQMYREMQEVARAVAHLDVLEPPARLKPEILRRVFRGQPRPVSEKKSFRRWLRHVVALVDLKFALTFAGGAVAGILLLVLVDGSGYRQTLLPEDLQGALLPVEPSETWNSAPPVTIRQAGLEGEIVARHSGQWTVLEFRLDSPETLAVAIDFSPDALRWKGFMPDVPGTVAFTAGAQQLHLRHSGKCRYHILFRKVGVPAAAIQLRIISGDAVRLDKQITF